MDELLAKLKGLPVVGALFKGAEGGSTSSEFGLLAALVAVATANASTMSLALGICLGGLGVGVGLYALSRARAKGEAFAAATKAGPSAPAAALLLALFLPAILLSGCQAIHTGTAKLRDLGTSVMATTEIIDAATDDVASVWDATGKKGTDAVGLTSSLPPLPPGPAK